MAGLPFGLADKGMIAACGSPPVDLVGRITGDIGPELPEITARADFAIAVQAAAQTDGSATRLINQLGQPGGKCTCGSNMIMHGSDGQLWFLLQVGKRIGNQALGGEAFGTGPIGQAKSMT